LNPGVLAVALAFAAPPDTALVRLTEFTNAVTTVRPAAPNPSSASDTLAHPFRRFAFLYEDEVGNRIDTIAGTVTKDLGPARADTTIALRLDPVEMRALYDRLIEMNFFSLPRTPPTLSRMRDPGALFTLVPGEPSSSWVHIDVRADTSVRRVGWNERWPFHVEGMSDELRRLHAWINEAWSLFARRAEYRALPARSVPGSTW
jgi:hypothetical protein